MKRTPVRRAAAKVEEKRRAAFLRLAAEGTLLAPLTGGVLPRGKKAIRTWREGEVGMWGTRRVLPGGFIVVAEQIYHAPQLETVVGSVVYFGDNDDTACRLTVSSAKWHDNGFVSGGEWLCHARPVSEFEQIATLALQDARTVNCSDYIKLKGIRDIIDMFQEDLAARSRDYNKDP